MITEKELSQIYSIVDDFGGDRKQFLMGRLKNLLNRHDRIVKKQIETKLSEVL
jgi:hypothetical protein